MEVIRVSVDVFCAILGCALGISPATSYSGGKILFMESVACQ